MADELDLNGPRGLREHAKGLRSELSAANSENATLRAELEQYHRRDALEAALEELGSEFDVTVTLDDLGEIPSKSITPELVTAKATEKADARAALFAELAKDSGTTPEELQRDIDFAHELRMKQDADRAASAAIAAGGQAMPTLESPSESASRTFEKMKNSGAPDDEAQAAWVREAREKQISDRR